jgi:hypothetical protein
MQNMLKQLILTVFLFSVLLLNTVQLVATSHDLHQDQNFGGDNDEATESKEPPKLKLQTLDNLNTYYYRLLQIKGITSLSPSQFIRPVANSIRSDSHHPWKINHGAGNNDTATISIRGISPVWHTSWNSSLPRGGNDGAMWQGRGLNTAISSGVRFEWGLLSAQILPTLVYSQNQTFDLMPYSTGSRSEYTYALRDVDFIQRYGDDPYRRVDFGESFIELRAYALALGAGHGSQWTGPAVNYPLLFSNNAPGFWHVRLGTWKPARTFAGNVEIRYLSGILDHSYYYKDTHTHRIKTIQMMLGSWTPWFAPGLSVGFLRMYIESTIQNPMKEPLAFLFNRKFFDPVRKRILHDRSPTGEGSDPDNQMITAFVRWQFPETGFEIYAELGRTDHTMDWRDFRLHPDHARAYVVGFIKVFELVSNRFIAMNAEITQLEDTRLGTARFGPIPRRGDSVNWYAHANNPFTHRGQMMGSDLDAGGNGRIYRMDYFYPDGRYGISLTRKVYLNTVVHNNFSAIRGAQLEYPALQPQNVRQAEFLVAFEHTRFLNQYGLELDGLIELGQTLNHHYLYKNDKTNLRLKLTIRKHFKGWLR